MATKDMDSNMEEGKPCLGCNKTRSDDTEDKFAVAMKRVHLLTAIMSVMFIVTLVACGSSVYMYFKINAIRTELATMLNQQSDYYYSYDPEYLTDDPDDATNYDAQSDEAQMDSPGRTKRKKGNKSRGACKGSRQAKAACKCCVKKVRSLIKSGRIELPTRTPVQQSTTKAPVTQQTEEKNFVAAAHYTTMIDNEYIEKKLGVSDHGNLKAPCMYVPEWGGKLCRNRTFLSSDAPTTLKMFKESAWMKNTTKLFDLKEDGSFVAKHDGIYLLYAHVLFYDVKTKQALGLLHESHGTVMNHFRCMESVDYVNPSYAHGQNARYKSCSVYGVLSVKTGDNIKVQSLYSKTEIDVTMDATYFGGVLLSVAL